MVVLVKGKMIAIKRMADAIIYIFLNYFVAYIPSWTIRKLFYLLFGMKIGKGSRIYMKCIVRSPWNISIGKNSIINENCIIDGRGGLDIGDNVSISLFSTIITASHDSKSADFRYIKGKVIIEDNVWIGTRSVILQNTRIKKTVILAAGSSIKGDTEEGYIYAGVPAKRMKERNLEGVYTINFYDFFR